MTLLEMCNEGTQPYYDIKDVDVPERVKSGAVPSVDQSKTPNILARIMMQW